ncbi:MAG: hypothetical protein AAFV98_18640 [Chloroflexota bacterium]
MFNLRWLFLLTTLFVYGVWSTQAQGTCNFDVQRVIQQVTEECDGMEANTVCYGNRDVTATPRIDTVDFVFDTPGDRVALPRLSSLVVDATGATAEEWGVAQMRLQVGSETGLQDVTMLLFGRFDVANAQTQFTTEFDLQIRNFTVDLYASPNTLETPINTVEAGTVVRALGRLDDSTWIRVETPERIIGWMENNQAGYTLVDDGDSIGLLPVQAADEPYYGAMQAFYFSNGESDIGCETVASDGLLINTAEGQARISLLINEVSFELTGIQEGGLSESGSAFIQADPTDEEGMQVSVINGEATVETDDGSRTVASGERSSVPLTVSLDSLGNTIFRPSGAPSETTPRDLDDVDVGAVVDVWTSLSGQGGTSGNGDGGTVTLPTGDNSANTGNTGNTGNSGSTGGQIDLSVNTGNGGNSGNGGNGGNNSSSSGNGGSSDVDTSNPFQNPDNVPLLPTSAPGDGQSDQVYTIEAITIIVVAIAAVIGLVVLAVSIWNTRRSRN